MRAFGWQQQRRRNEKQHEKTEIFAFCGRKSAFGSLRGGKKAMDYLLFRGVSRVSTKIPFVSRLGFSRRQNEKEGNGWVTCFAGGWKIVKSGRGMAFLREMA